MLNITPSLDHLIGQLHLRAMAIYIRLFGPRMRQLFELIALFEAVFLFVFLVLLHMRFVNKPAGELNYCLEPKLVALNNTHWDILRIDVMLGDLEYYRELYRKPLASDGRDINKPMQHEYGDNLDEDYYDEDDYEDENEPGLFEALFGDYLPKVNTTDAEDELDDEDSAQQSNDQTKESGDNNSDGHAEDEKNAQTSDSLQKETTAKKSTSTLGEEADDDEDEAEFDEDDPFAQPVELARYYFSKEDGFLWLTRQTFRRLNLTRQVVKLYSNDTLCFGGRGVQMAFLFFFGYDSVILNDLAQVFEHDGYVYADKLHRLSEKPHPYAEGLQEEYAAEKVAMLLVAVLLSTAAVAGIGYVVQATLSTLLSFSHNLSIRFQQQLPIGPLLWDLMTRTMLFGVVMACIFAYFEFVLGSIGLTFSVAVFLWCTEFFRLASVRTFKSMLMFPRLVSFYFFLFIFYLLTHPFGMHTLAFLTLCAFVEFTLLWCYHHYEIPAVQAGIVGPARLREGMGQGVQINVQIQRNGNQQAQPQQPQQPQQPHQPPPGEQAQPQPQPPMQPQL